MEEISCGYCGDPEALCKCGLDVYEEPYCLRCDGLGVILVCPDDLCRGAGECMHGDGEIACPNGCAYNP